MCAGGCLSSRVDDMRFVSLKPTRPAPTNCNALSGLFCDRQTIFSHDRKLSKMAGSVQISSPSQLSTLLSSSRLVVVHCRLCPGFHHHLGADILQSTMSGVLRARPSPRYTTSLRPHSPGRELLLLPRYMLSSKHRLRKAIAPQSRLTRWQVLWSGALS